MMQRLRILYVLSEGGGRLGETKPLPLIFKTFEPQKPSAFLINEYSRFAKAVFVVFVSWDPCALRGSGIILSFRSNAKGEVEGL